MVIHLQKKKFKTKSSKEEFQQKEIPFEKIRLKSRRMRILEEVRNTPQGKDLQEKIITKKVNQEKRETKSELKNAGIKEEYS